MHSDSLTALLRTDLSEAERGRAAAQAALGESDAEVRRLRGELEQARHLTSTLHTCLVYRG